ncbi:MAG: hypothetical protein J6J23_06715 [Clostridia bacterium]|nr:hypothetical protein [Clostridia bacterium]
MENTRKIFKVQLFSSIIGLTVFGAVVFFFVYACIYSLRDNEYIVYKEKYDKYYKHQLNYLMNEPINAGDKHDPEKLCKIITVKFTACGNIYNADDKSYNNKYIVTVYNNSDEDITDVEVTIPYVTHLGERGKRWVHCDDISGNSYATAIVDTAKYEYIAVEGFAYVTTDDCTSPAICYEEFGYDVQLPEENAKTLVDEEVINNIIGGKVEPKTQGELISDALPYMIPAGILSLIFVFVVIRTIGLLKKIKNGEVTVVNGKVVLLSPELKEQQAEKQHLLMDYRYQKQLKKYENKNKQEQEMSDKTPLPSDFDDGHPTTHDCGGFDINPDDFKIDPNDY